MRTIIDLEDSQASRLDAWADGLLGLTGLAVWQMGLAAHS